MAFLGWLLSPGLETGDMIPRISMDYPPQAGGEIGKRVVAGAARETDCSMFCWRVEDVPDG